ncbi:MAG TPA: 50S ribosomal protein L15 [Candidatus Limnocylindrales bacterium]|nr:50S ribosomal protein L15 [Candidatus Limnocylindrales bacterium]
MKIHDLHPAEGSVTRKTRVGRGIAAGKGKTAGRGTKGQRSRAGASIPAWFEGGQTPLHIRIPKLRGFRNINDIQYEVVNVGAISAAIEAGRLEVQKGAPVTVNADTLKQAGLVRRDRLPLKILGMGEVTTTLFVLADAFTKSAREKIEAAGGTAQVIEIPSEPMAALGVEAGSDDAPAPKPAKAPRASKAAEAEAVADADEAPVADEPAPEPEAAAVDEADASADEADAPADNG